MSSHYALVGARVLSTQFGRPIGTIVAVSDSGGTTVVYVQWNNKAGVSRRLLSELVVQR